MIKTSELQDGFKILNKGGKSQYLNYVVIEKSNLYLINLQSGDTAIVDLGRTHLEDGKYRIKSNIKKLQKGLKFFKNHSSTTEMDIETISFRSDRKVVVVDIEKSDLEIDLNTEYSKEFKFEFKDFKTRMDSIVPLKAKDNVRPMINGVHFNSNHIVALDGYRMGISIDRKTNNKLDPMTLTGQTTDYLVDILKIIKNESEITIRTTDKKVEFQIGNIRLVSDLYEGSYFNYRDIIRDDSDDSTKINNVDVKKLLDDIKFIESMSDQGRLIDGQIKGYSKDDLYNIKNKVDLQYEVEGKEIDISFNIKFMRELLNANRKLTDTIDIGFKDSLSPILFRSESSIYLLLPIRVAY